ncbi:hypothetical protein N9Y67_02750 [Pseudomonadota bacterium]|nr:hypothetical protein [Pseudomonadota bacterium]
MSKADITLILPGIAPVLKQQINNSILPVYLKNIIKQARFTADETKLNRLLVNQFSQQTTQGTDLPLASLFGEKLIFADPCHLLPDRDRLILFADHLDITVDERTALMAEVEPLLAEFNAEFVQQTDSEHWLLKIKQQPDLTLTALEDVSSKGLDESLPQGPDRQDWLRLWNEIQMQLFNAKVNQQRIAQGKLAINSVWFWGMGEFVSQANRWDVIIGKHSLLKQLAQRSDSEVTETINYSKAATTKAKQLWLLDDVDLESDWLTEIERIDELVLKPLWQASKKAKLSQLTIHIPDYGYFKLTPLDCWKFWKR